MKKNGESSLKFMDYLVLRAFYVLSNSTIKPHLPFYDSPLDIKLADWIYNLLQELKNIIENSDLGKTSNPYSINIHTNSFGRSTI